MNASRENAALWEKPIGRGIVHRGFPIEMRPLHRIHSGQGTEDRGRRTGDGGSRQSSVLSPPGS